MPRHKGALASGGHQSLSRLLSSGRGPSERHYGKMDVAGEQFEVQPSEKFACMVLSGLLLRFQRRSHEPHYLGRGCWASANLPFKLDDWCIRQLGEFIVGQLRMASDPVLTAKLSTLRPDLLDAENQLLCGRLRFLFWGMAAVVGVPSFASGWLLSGARTASGCELRDVRCMPPFYSTEGTAQPDATVDDLRRTVRLAGRLEKMRQERKADDGRYYRLASGLGAFDAALQAHQAAARHHQFVRTIESFLPPSVFGQKEFSQYAGRLLSANPRTDGVLRQMYELRSAAEHHRRFDTRALSGVANAEAVAMQRTRQAEAFARELFRRFFAENEDCLRHFKDDDALNSLWSNTGELKRIWGRPFDIHAIT
jgi:hypothetical protein